MPANRATGLITACDKRYTHKENPDMQLRGVKYVATVGGAVAVALLAACSSSSSSSTSSPGATSAPGETSAAAAASGTLNGSGSTLQLTFQQAAIAAFKSTSPSITVNYAGVGSGTGRANLYANTVNFAGSDSSIPATEQSKVPAGATVLYYPVLIGPIAVTYNLPNVTNLKLDGPVLANIFSGKVTTWNDPAIKALNSGASLPSTPITLAVRSDSSGTTQNFSLFLQEAGGSAWALGSSSTIKWPSTAHAASGNGGVATVVKSTVGAIGYNDYATAKASNLSTAVIKNKDGNYVAPSTAAASAAADGAAVASNLTFHAVWAPGAQAYPITAQSWILVYQKQPNANDVALLKAYIGYLLSSQGQALLAPLGYAPLPSSLDAKAQAQLSMLTS
ncbi:MAG TPA: phosphate ABC transporter substrate-binding protein PstS [Trebonia sp.]|nr:phosphate ABC transporter substrate-binding protein PstS [Trebonia sp.]